MGTVSIWNTMEAADKASEKSTCQIQHSSLPIDPSLSLSQITPRIIDLCKDLFETWYKLDNSCFSIETVSGGITNLLLKVSVKEDNGNDVAVTVRLYGPNTDYVINRERELQAIKYLSAAGFGAVLLAVFSNGMVQSFINARTLVPLDMKNPKLASEIAKQLREFHQVEVPGSKEPQLWNDMFKFFGKASTLEFADGEKQKIYETISFKDVHKEIIELKDLTDRFNAPVVSHTMICSLETLWSTRKKINSISLISSTDHTTIEALTLEITSMNTLAMIVTSAFFRYPTIDEQYHFFWHYLQPDSPQEVSEKDLEALYVKANIYTLASHLYWALWGIIQSKISPIDFDRVGYFFHRYNEYKKQKENFFSLAISYLSKSGTT